MAELYHHGILGMKWGIRRYQPYGQGGYDPQNEGKNVGQAAALSKRDTKWARKNTEKITSKAKKESRRELEKYGKELLRSKDAVTKSGKLSAQTVNAYNRKMAELMTKNCEDLRSPDGKVVQFVAKRGEIGVYMALADQGYNIDQLKNGVWGSGRIAYKKSGVGVTNI